MSIAPVFTYWFSTVWRPQNPAVNYAEKEYSQTSENPSILMPFLSPGYLDIYLLFRDWGGMSQRANDTLFKDRD